MRPASRLLDIALILRPILQGDRVRRTVAGVIGLTMLAMLVVALLALALTALFYGIYLECIAYGLAERHAVFAVVGMMLTLALSGGLVLRWRLKCMRRSTLPSLETVTTVIDEFLDGLRKG